MIIKTSITLKFPAGAFFTEAPALIFYKKLLQMIKKISCMNPDIKCNECPLQKDCRYFWITGNNFERTPGIFCKHEFFDPKLFTALEQCVIEIIWIGEAKDYSVLIEPMLDFMNHILNGQVFQLQKIESEQIESKLLRIKASNVVSPFAGKQDQFFKKMKNDFEELYQESLDLPDKEFQFVPAMKTNMDPIKLSTRRINPSGFTGRIEFEEPVEMDSRMIDLGIGSSNFIGGGKLEVEHFI